MSRQEFQHPAEQKSMAVGTDHAFGNFIQIWDNSKYPEPDSDNIILDEDKLSWPAIQNIITEHGFKQIVGIDI